MNVNTKHVNKYTLFVCLIFISAIGHAEERIDMKGISIIGNKELPNVLYIVPWKSPDLPDMNEPTLTSLIDAALEPLNRETVLRKELYYKVLDKRKTETMGEKNNAKQN